MKLLFILLVVAIIPANLLAQDYVLRSPNGKAEVRLKVADKVYYSIFYNQKPVVAESAIALMLKENPNVGVNPKVVDKKERKINQMVTAIVPEKRRAIKEVFNELQLTFGGNYGLIWRVYDSGAAYRWTTNLPGKIIVSDEEAEINLAAQDALYYPEEESFYSHNERKYIKYKSAEIGEKLSSLPALVATESGTKLWLSEADLYDYAGMWLKGTNGKGVKAVFPQYPAKEVQEKDRDLKVIQRADYIAQTSGKRFFPWRIFGLAERDADLLDNQLSFLLSEDTKDDYSWVKPGKVAWDWWNANNVYGVDFKSGINTATYKYYVDFASKHGLEYIILDEGWTKTTEDLMNVTPDLDLPELLDYAKKKNVGAILWVLWLPLEKDMGKILDLYQKWGVKGIKVDFMQRDDQKMVAFYERTAREAAKRKLMVDFHGAYKPTGMKRKYPNVMTSEGVKGLENSKWSKDITPEHDLTLPFTRMVAGPMDYTPGAMLNASEKDFVANFNRPMSQGTRCHQLGMYVIYESPLQMLADTPSNYLREPETMDFLSKVPAVWDETVVIDGKIGEYAIMARRALNGNWYVGAMTKAARQTTIDLSFLGGAKYEAQIYQDGINTDRMASDYQRLTKTFKKGDKLLIKMAAGGGFAARFVSN